MLASPSPENLLSCRPREGGCEFRKVRAHSHNFCWLLPDKSCPRWQAPALKTSLLCTRWRGFCEGRAHSHKFCWWPPDKSCPWWQAPALKTLCWSRGGALLVYTRGGKADYYVIFCTAGQRALPPLWPCAQNSIWESGCIGLRTDHKLYGQTVLMTSLPTLPAIGSNPVASTRGSVVKQTTQNSARALHCVRCAAHGNRGYYCTRCRFPAPPSPRTDRASPSGQSRSTTTRVASPAAGALPAACRGPRGGQWVLGDGIRSLALRIFSNRVYLACCGRDSFYSGSAHRAQRGDVLPFQLFVRVERAERVEAVAPPALLCRGGINQLKSSPRYRTQ